MASNGGVAQTMRCLGALSETVPESLVFEVVFVDNGSSDATASALRAVEGDFVLLRNDEQRDLATALGQAARTARGEILIWVGTDVVTQAGWLERLLADLRGDPALEAVRPEGSPNGNSSLSRRCVAVRRETIATALLSDQEAGAALAELTSRATTSHGGAVTTAGPGAAAVLAEAQALAFPPLSDTVRGETFVADLAAAYDPARGGHGMTMSSPLTAVLLDGARPAAERAIAGALLTTWDPSDAVAAAARAVVAKVSPQDRERIASLLAGCGFDEAWRRLLGSVTSADDVVWWGLVEREPEYAQVIEDLHLLNDVLARSALAGRWWIFGGMLLGWARDGDLIPGDLDDFDFAFAEDDVDRFRSALLDLVKAGFVPRYRYPSVLEPLTALTVVRHGTKFEFYKMEHDGTDHYKVASYGHLDGVTVRNTHSHPRQPLVPIDFLGRLWLKSEDHDAELTHEYHDWRTPDPDWDYMRAHNIVDRVPWDRGAYDLLHLAIW